MTSQKIAQLAQAAYQHMRAGQTPQAIQAFQAWLTAAPNNAEGWYNFAVLLKQAGAYPQALNAYEQALKYKVASPEEVHLNRAVIYSDAYRNAEAARAELQAALKLNPTYQPAQLNLANIHEDLGERDAAKVIYEDILKRAPGHALALSRLAGLTRNADLSHPLIGQISKQLERPDLEGLDRAELGFALARLLDQVGDYDRAFEALSAANQINASLVGVRYDPAQTRALVERNLAANFPQGGDACEEDKGRPEPVFILGMYRSGSTLTEQLLAAHPEVQSAGELALLQQISQAFRNDPVAVASAGEQMLASARQHYRQHIQAMSKGQRYMTDKQPLNFWQVGLIKRLFPRTKIIHTVRDPLDTAISLFFQHLHPSAVFSHSLEAIADYILAERKLMAHWKTLWPDDILEVRYEALVSSQRAETERLLAFLGLDWSDQCLDFHTADTMVRTASVWQVREKMHDRSVGRWRHYESHLEGISKVLSSDAD